MDNANIQQKMKYNYQYYDGVYIASEEIKKTEEDWYPNLPNNVIKVRVSFRPDAYRQNYIVYFCAIGGSNYRYEAELKTSILQVAIDKHESWIKIFKSLPETVTKQMFSEIGMKEKTE